MAPRQDAICHAVRARVSLSSLRTEEEEDEEEKKKLLRSSNLSAHRGVMMSVFLMARRSVGPGWAPPGRDTANQSTRGGFGVTTRRISNHVWLCRCHIISVQWLVRQESHEVKGRFNGGAEKSLQLLHFQCSLKFEKKKSKAVTVVAF